MWKRIHALIIKEFLAVWKDRKSRFVLIGPPIIQLLIFGYAATFDVNNVTLAVLNEDTGVYGRELVARFTASGTFTPMARLGHVSEIRGTIESRKAVIALHVGETFSRDLMKGGPAKVQIIVDGRSSNTAAIVVNYANAIIEDFNREIAARGGLPGPASEIIARAWFNPALISRWFFVPGLVVVLTMVVTTIVTALSIARERELGTFEQLLVTPLRPLEILIGKTVPPFIIGFGEATVVVIVAVLFFRIPFQGSLFLLYAGLCFFLVAVVGIGLMISSIAKTQQQAVLGMLMIVFPAVLLSGFATPIANMPEWIEIITRANPIRYFLVIVRGQFLQDMPLEVVADEMWPLALIALVSMSVATWFFRRRVA